jgi:hypothetical protein
MRMIRKAGLLSGLASVLAVAASASPATAAVTLGQTGDPTAFCGSTSYIAQTATGGAPGYAVPSGYGVITSWSFQGESTPGTGKFLVWRPTGTPNQYILLHKSPPEAFIAGTVRTFLVRFPVMPNDVLGMVADQSCLLFNGFMGDVARYGVLGTEPAEGSPQTLGGMIPERILVSAKVEADADHDNFGDETQDQCPTNAATTGPCPTAVAAPTGQRAAAIKKCKKKYPGKAKAKKRKKCKKRANLLPV